MPPAILAAAVGAAFVVTDETDAVAVGVTMVPERVLPETVTLSVTLTEVLPVELSVAADDGAEVMVAEVGALVEGMVSIPALRLEQTARPALWAWASSVALHLVSRQPAPAAAMAAWVGPHWQGTSLSAQPAAVMAEVRQGIYRGRTLVHWLPIPP